MSGLLLLGQTVPLLGNPTGGAVVAGSATIGPAGSTLTINQASNTAIINWQTFSIAGGETTKFIVPNSTSATLNRVTGGNPSAIYGTLQSNGQVFLINPSGILVGAGGRIDTAGFLGSTLDVSNDAFLKGGDMHFAGSSSA
jgi:filamentous hemagglutinin family protein